MRRPGSPVSHIGRQASHYFFLPTITIVEKFLFVIDQLGASFSGKFEIRAFYNGINWTGFLTQTAIDALHHVNIVTCCSPASIPAWFGFYGDGLGRTDGFAQLAGDAALFTVGITAQRVLTAKPRRKGSFFIRIIQCGTVSDRVAQSSGHTEYKVREKKPAEKADEKLHQPMSLGIWATWRHASPHLGIQPNNCRIPATTTTAASEIGRNIFHPSRINWS